MYPKGGSYQNKKPPHLLHHKLHNGVSSSVPSQTDLLHHRQSQQNVFCVAETWNLAPQIVNELTYNIQWNKCAYK